MKLCFSLNKETHQFDNLIASKMKTNPIALTTIIVASTAVALAEPPNESTDKVYELENFDVVSTGTRTERLIHEAPVKTELLVAEDFENYNVSSLKDAFKLIPSARFEADCQNCRLNQIQLLGLSTDYTAILFDGAPLYSGLAKVYGADLFPAVFIDRIEVVKGGSSVLYGAEAMAGVVNLITSEPSKSGFETEIGYSSVLGDTDDYEVSFRGDYSAPDGSFSFTGYGYYVDEEAVDLTTDGFSDIPEFENMIVGAQAWWRPNEDATLRGNYQYMDQSHRGGDLLDEPEEQARVAESLAHEIHIAQVSWKKQVGPDFDYSLGASYMYIERESFYGARGDSEQRAFEGAGNVGDVTDLWIASNQAAIDAVARRTWGLTENHVFYFDSQFNHYFGDHTLSYGVQYRHEELTDGPLFGNTSTPTTEDDFSDIGFFIQDQWAITPHLELVPGVRVDDHGNVDDAIVSPRLAGRFFATDELTLRASWSTGFNAPGAFNEDQHIGVNQGGAISLINASDLEEEKSQTFSFGGEFQPKALNGQMILHSQVHYTLLQDAFEIDDSGTVTGDENIWLRVNGPDANVFVWENNVSWQLTDYLSLDSGLSYIRARFDDPIDRVTGLSTDEFIERPEWTGHIGLAYENDDLFSAHALLNYTGEMIAVGEDSDIWRRTDPFYVVDIGLSKDFHGVLGTDHITVSLGIENLFDERQDDLQNNGEDRDPTYLYGPNQPRTYYFKVTANW